MALSTSTTLGGGLTLNGGGTLNLGANQLTLGTGSALALSGGAIDITLGTASGQIMSSGSLTLAGGTLVLNTAGAGFSYDTSYQVISGLGTNDLSSLTITGYDSSDYTAHLDDTGDLSFTANNLSAVPEPSTYALIAGVAALGFACVRRRWAA